MQLLQTCIGPTICIGPESWCLSYSGFLLPISSKLRPHKIYDPCAIFLGAQLNDGDLVILSLYDFAQLR